MAALHQIIRRPLVTAKNNLLRTHNVYVFEVDRRATKPLIRKAVEKLFRVKVNKVRTSVKPRLSRARQQAGGARTRWYEKKAMVQLKKGEKINLFEGA